MEELKLEDLSFGDGNEVFDAFSSKEVKKGDEIKDPSEEEKKDPNEIKEPDGEGVKSPESVAEGDKDIQGQADKTDKDGEANSSSPNSNDSEQLYSTLAKHFLTNEVLSDLDPKEIKSLDDLNKALLAQTEKRFDDRQKAISEAMKVGAPVEKIGNQLDAIKKLEGIDVEKLSSPENKEVRYNLMVMDSINKGYSEERAKVFAQRSVDAGTEVEDSKFALVEIIKNEKESYKGLIKTAKDEEDASLNDIKTFLGREEGVLPNIKLNTAQQGELYKKITTDTGNRESAFVKYQRENPLQSRVQMEAIFHLTKELTDFSLFTNGAKTEANKEVEDLLRGTSFTESGKVKTEVADPMANFTLKDFESEGLKIGE